MMALLTLTYVENISSPQFRYSIEKSYNNCFAFTNFFSIPLFVSLKLEATFGNMDNDLSRHANIENI